jgi:predicted phosphodiesterase
MKEIFEKEQKIIKIERAKRVIFVGDTHGDLEASQKVIKDYLIPGNKIVFLGDYVDRGPLSKENLDFLLEQKEKYPDQVFLLQGNHESHRILKFSPAEFWGNLSEKEYQKYSQIVEKFPLTVVVKNIIALHGALPEIEKLEDFEKIKIGDENWFRICWGDFLDEPGEELGIDPFTGRPQFGINYFLKIMEKINKKTLIRSHDPNAPRLMYNDLCLTIFTSSAYTGERIIAIANLSKEIKTAKDLEIRRI